MKIQEIAREMKLTAPLLGAVPVEKRNEALGTIKELLLAHREEIFAENEKDLAEARRLQISQQVQKRLRFDAKKLSDVCDGIDQLIRLPDPLGRTLLDRMLDTDLELRRVSVPIGVIGVIFEARPDALVQISSLCVKSGNCVILKGGKETTHTNRILSKLILEGLQKTDLPDPCFYQAEERSEIGELLSCEGEVDLLIPRGSNAFVRYIMDHTKIPVMGHADGVCHVYVDRDADLERAPAVIVDAKTQYPVACNAAETVLVHREIAKEFLPILKDTLMRHHVVTHGTREAAKIISCEPLGEDAFHHEYGDLELTIALVSDVKEAADHINRYGSHHTDCILTENQETAECFTRLVDSAGVYVNCSTRFADGFRYGFGAEVGISTSKLHARGPVGLEGLVTYKYILRGKGQIVADYASGKASFHFAEVPGDID